MNRAARRTDLDLLRVIICATVILAHALLIFAAEPAYHVKSAVAWPVATVLYEGMRIATLCIFFALAGWSSVASCRGRTVGRYVGDRVTRVLVPLIAGVILQGPIIKFIELSQGRDLRMAGFREVTPLKTDFLAFAARYFTRSDLLTWSHLWFLAYLFLISIALLPVLRVLARRAPSHTMPSFLTALLPGVALAALVLVTHGYWPFLPNLARDGANLLLFAACFGLGALFAAWPGFEARLRADAPWLLVLALAALAGVVLAGPSPLGRVCVGLCAWGCIGAAFGFAGRHPPPPTPLLTWLGEATMPVYVLHHIPVLVLGVLVLPLGWSDGVKVLAIWLPATLIALTLYRLAVLPWRVPRFLLGMAPPRPAVRVEPVRQGAT